MERLDRDLRAGDILLRIGLGEPAIGHVAVLVDGRLATPDRFWNALPAAVNPDPSIVTFWPTLADASVGSAGVPVSATLTIRAHGPDAQQAVDAIAELIAHKFGEK